MPLYEYQCDACGGRFERIVKFSDPPLDEPCASCGGHVTKLMSSPAIQFKGSGWYVNDYAKSGKSEKPGESGESRSSSEKSEKAESSSEGKESKDTKKETSSDNKSETPKPAAHSAAKTDKS